MTANDTAAASYQLRRKEREADTALMRQALEALESAYIIITEHVEEDGISEPFGEEARPLIDALNERLLRE